MSGFLISLLIIAVVSSLCVSLAIYFVVRAGFIPGVNAPSIYELFGITDHDSSYQFSTVAAAASVFVIPTAINVIASVGNTTVHWTLEQSNQAGTKISLLQEEKKTESNSHYFEIA